MAALPICTIPNTGIWAFFTTPAEGCLPAHRRLHRRCARFLRGISGRADARGDADRLLLPATRACTCCTSRPRRASFRARSAGTTSPLTSVDRHAHGAAGWRARGVLPRHLQSGGVKVGAAWMTPWLQGLVATLNPQNQPGRLTFIHRFGAKDIDTRCRGRSRRCARPGNGAVDL